VSDRAIELRGVGRRYSHFALQGVDLDVPDGSVLGLVGPNGAGKSTLLRILIGLVRADAGRVSVLGRPMPQEERWIKARVGFVSEDMALYGAATLGWHMRLVRDMSPGWDELLLAMARRAELLVLDEPTAGLDPLVRHEILSLLKDTRGERRALVFSSHYGDDVASLADDVAFVHGGRLIAHAPVAELLRGGASLEQAFLERVGGLHTRRAA